MGVLDDVAGIVKEAIDGGGGEHSALVNEVLGLPSAGDRGGGLPGLIRTFQDGGMDDMVSSRAGTGQNLLRNNLPRG